MKKRGFVELKFAKLDIDRENRRGFPEIIYAPQKTPSQLKSIIRKFRKYSSLIFISRIEPQVSGKLKKTFPSLRYYKQARLAFLGKEQDRKKGKVIIITAGTSDIRAAEEAAVFLKLTGNSIERIYDVGVAGIHRLIPFKKKIQEAAVIIVAAGMEAALLSVVAGLARAPVIGVPTSAGYGASFNGLAALLGMMNVCSPGVTVVNIDNGLGAGYFANLINK